jgi:hypothetical chaperone protein
MYTLAVDFGTSNSLVGAYCFGDGKTKPHRIEAMPLDPSASDPSLIRTLMYFPSDDICFYGTQALQEFVSNDMDGRLFRSFKTHLPNKNYLGTTIGNRILSLEALVGTFLLELKKRAENYLNVKIDSVVLGKPARYSMDEVADAFALYRMRKAAEFAGFKDITFVPEPLAAALDYRRNLTEEKNVLIGDFGGGTSDFTIMKMSGHQFQKSDVLGVDGCPFAGDALDSVFMSERLNEHFGAKAKYKMSMSSNVLTMPPLVVDRLNKPAHIMHLKDKDTYNFIQEVRKCALNPKDVAAIDRLFTLIEDQQIYSFFEKIEETKRKLSAEQKTIFDFDYTDLELKSEFSREDFELWSQTIKTKIVDSLDRCLKQAQLTDQQIDIVFLTGGTGHVPFVRSEFEKRFGTEKIKTSSFFHSVLSGLIEAAKYKTEL